MAEFELFMSRSPSKLEISSSPTLMAGFDGKADVGDRTGFLGPVDALPSKLSLNKSGGFDADVDVDDEPKRYGIGDAWLGLDGAPNKSGMGADIVGPNRSGTPDE